MDPFIGVRIPTPEPVQRAIDGQSIQPARTPRSTLVRALLATVGDALDVSETKAARVALDALNALIDDDASAGAGVVHLADERAKRRPPK